MARYAKTTPKKFYGGRNRRQGSAVLKELAYGAYNRYQVSGTTASLGVTLGTEVECAGVAANIKGDDTNKIAKVFPWIRITLTSYIGSGSSGVGLPIEFCLMKSKQSDSLENISDSDVLERKMRAGEVFWRKLVPMRNATYSAVKSEVIEYKNVKLLPDEELRLFYLPWFTLADGVWIWYDIEWREPQYG